MRCLRAAAFPDLAANKKGGGDLKMSISEEIIKTWKENPEIREEFNNDLAAYAAFREAEANGLVKFTRAPIIK